MEQVKRALASQETVTQVSPEPRCRLGLPIRVGVDAQPASELMVKGRQVTPSSVPGIRARALLNQCRLHKTKKHTNCDCGQKNVKRQFFAIFESGHSFEFGFEHYVFRNIRIWKDCFSQFDHVTIVMSQSLSNRSIFENLKGLHPSSLLLKYCSLSSAP